MPPKLQFVPPNEKNPININFPESYRRKLRAFGQSYLKVVEPGFQEKRQMRHWASKGIVDPSLITTELLGIKRTKLRGNDFEDEEGNIIRGPKAPKIGLTYMLWESIADQKSIDMGNPPDAFPLSTDTFTEGMYRRPSCKIETDERNNIVKSTLSGAFDCYYIEATPESIKSVLEKYPKHKNFRMTISDDGASNLSIHNEDDFINGDINDLAAANRLGFLTKDGKKGGITRYHKYKEKLDNEGQPTALETVTTTVAEPKPKKNVQQQATA